MFNDSTRHARGRSKRLALSAVLVLAGVAALVLATTGSSVNNNLFKSQHGKFANGKAIPHPAGATEVAWDEERQEAGDAQSGTAGASDLPPDASASSIGCANRGSATNPRVNQDCTLRRQAEEQIAVNPLNPQNLIAGQNDSRIGFNHCGFDYSLDGGAHWGDGIPPYYQHLNPGTGHTYDAASDPNVTFTGTGRAWYSCVVFDVFSNASGLFASPSTPQLMGSAYANIPAGASNFVVAETNDGHTFYDKQFMAGDPRAGHSEAYITFTVFLSDQKCSNGNNPGAYCSSEIWYSKWNGSAWSAPANLSGSSSTLCNFGDTFDKKADPHACNFNQGSMPVVSPADGSVFVVWNNGNTATLLNQQLGRKINADGSLGPVVKVGQDEESNVALCDFGRGPEECVKSLNVRTNNFPAVAVDPTNASHLVAVWQDSRNVAAGSGAYKVVVSESTNGGTTWSDAAGGGATISGAAGEALFEPSVAITQGGKVAVSYYKANAYSGAAVGGGTFGYWLASGASWTQQLVSDSGTMPGPQANAAQQGFLGDYSSIAASTAAASNVVYPIWSDTRNSSAAGPDEDIFVRSVTIP